MTSRPGTVWVELSSKCPFDCIFCSRRNRRGDGLHMDIALIGRLMAELSGADLIRLNYSGESVNHPYFDEALHLAKGTGAQTELVSALATIPASHLRALVDSGLDRLSISLHTLDAREFDRIYRFSSLDMLQTRLAELQKYKDERGSKKPEIDFAFVAMQRNLPQLDAVVAYAGEFGATRVSVHPVIRRDPADADVSFELAGPQRLRPAFARALSQAAANAARNHPDISIEISRPLFDSRVSANAAGRFTCEQNPFDTMHILADGSIVPCEVLDRRILGNLNVESLANIWTGANYNAFRSDYDSSRVDTCNRCEFRKPVFAVGPVLPLYGWHDRDTAGTLWSRGASEARLERAGAGILRLHGLLPPGSQGRNRLDCSSDGKVIGTVLNTGMRSIEFTMELRFSETSSRLLSLTAAEISCLAAGGKGADVRQLGFAFNRAEWVRVPGCGDGGQSCGLRPGPDPREKRIDSFFRLLQRADSKPLRVNPVLPLPDAAREGISVVIPARGAVGPLIECLESLGVARGAVNEPFEVVVIANGSDLDACRLLECRFRWAAFHYHPGPLGFSRAIGEALRWVDRPWVYLLNSDMSVAADALAKLLPHRGKDVFGIGSRILMADGGSAESGLTGIRMSFGRAEIFDLDPGAGCAIQENLYCGGGSSLFRTALLKPLANETSCYDPFYWEDVEWGVSARYLGFRNLFVPASTVRHRRRATISQFYSPEETDRIFERNRLLFQLRCLPLSTDSGALRHALKCADPETLREIFHPSTLLSSLRQRRRILGSGFPEMQLSTA